MNRNTANPPEKQSPQSKVFSDDDLRNGTLSAAFPSGGGAKGISFRRAQGFRAAAGVAQTVLGLIFMLSAVLKAVDVTSFAEQIPYYGIIRADGAVRAAAWATLISEAALGVALCRRWRPKLVLPATLALLLAFTVLILYAWAFRGLAECGCFGRFLPMTPGVSVIKNVLMMALAGMARMAIKAEIASARRSAETRRAWRRGFLAGSGAGFLATVAAGLLAVVGGSLLLQERTIRGIESRFPDPVLPGTPMGYDWEVVALDGSSRSMETMKGKAAFLFLFSADCPECLAQLPSVDRLYPKATSLGVEVLCIATEDNDRLHRLIETRKVAFPVYTFKGDRPALFKKATSPAVYILSPGGTVAYQHFGGLKWDDEACLLFLGKLASSPEATAATLRPGGHARQ